MAMSATYLKPIPTNIPKCMADSKRWTVWKPIKRGDGKKPGKMPMYNRLNPLTETYEAVAASLDNPETWMTLDEAKKMLTSTKFKGFQYVLPYSNESTPTENRIVGVDLDDVMLSDGVTIKPEIQSIIDSFNSYTELSPSGKGIRIFCYGSFPVNELVHQGKFEIYQFDKLLTVTGNHLVTTPKTVNPAQAAIDSFRKTYFKPVESFDENKLPVTPVDFTDDEVLELLNNYKLTPQFKKLFYEGFTDGEDYSVLEKDLCKLVCFFTQKAEQIDRIYRASALSRDKWDSPRGSSTYGLNTILFVLKTRKSVYNPATSNASMDEINNFNVDLYPFTVRDGTEKGNVNVDLYPFTVRDGTEKGIFKEVPMRGTDETILVQIASTPCVIVAIGENIDDGSILYKLKIKDVRGHVKYVWKTTTDLMTKASVLKLLGDGLHFKESNATAMIDFFDKFTTTYGSKLKSDFAASVGGWKKNFTMYVIGNRAITSDGVQEILQLDTQFSSHYGCAGTVEGWVKSAKLISEYPAVRYKMYVSCVPPILRLLYLTSYILDNHVRSGRMKSVSNWLAASIHGNPTEQQAGGDSTTVGVMGLVEYCIDIPTFLDETSQNIEAARKLGYRIGNVGSRLKGSQNGSGDIQSSAITATVLLATGENPIIPDNANGGEEVRVKSLTEGVSDTFSVEETTEMEILMRENYGHVIVLFIQELFTLKDQLKAIYSSMLAGFPSVDDLPEDSRISASRVQKQYAAEATAGYILERVFAKIGLPSMNPLDVCTRYYNMNVVDRGFTPDYLKALEIAYKFFLTNEVYFHEDLELNHTQYGWIREEKTTKHPLICFDEGQLKSHMIKNLGPNRYESAVSMWKDLEILNVRQIEKTDSKGKKTGEIKVLHTVQIKVNNKNTTVLQIPIRNFYKFLNIPDDPKETVPPKSNDEGGNDGDEYGVQTPSGHNETDLPSIKVPQMSVNVPPVSSVSASFGEAINIHKTGDDSSLHELMLDLGFTGDEQ